VEQIGHTDVDVDWEFELDDVYAEWQRGVFRADRPADSAICRSGCDGNERSSWCVCTNRSERYFQRSGEKSD
jgi:hypothetical protein